MYLFIYFCTLSSRILNQVPSKEILAFQNKAEVYCQKYDVLIVPPWGVVSYISPGSWKPGMSSYKMNPWTNYMRHMAFHGVAISWLPREKVLTPPADVVLEGNIGDWLMRSVEQPSADQKRS